MIEEIIQESKLNPKLFEELYNSMEEFSFPKNTLIVRKDEKCNFLYFVESGLLRIYYYNEKGNDISHWFSSEQQLCTIPDSFFQQNPSRFYIETLEDSVIRGLTLSKLNFYATKNTV